jgi:hypothetical protein
MVGEEEKCIQVLVGKAEEGTMLKKPRCRCKCNIRIDLKEIGWEGMDWIHMAQGRNQWWNLVNTIMKLWFA